MWSAAGEISEEQLNEVLIPLAGRYERELGPEVRPYLASLFILTKRGFDTLPSPLLSDEDIMEKVELED